MEEEKIDFIDIPANGTTGATLEKGNSGS